MQGARCARGVHAPIRNSLSSLIAMGSACLGDEVAAGAAEPCVRIQGARASSSARPRRKHRFRRRSWRGNRAAAAAGAAPRGQGRAGRRDRGGGRDTGRAGAGRADAISGSLEWRRTRGSRGGLPGTTSNANGRFGISTAHAVLFIFTCAPAGGPAGPSAGRGGAATAAEWVFEPVTRRRPRPCGAHRGRAAPPDAGRGHAEAHSAQSAQSARGVADRPPAAPAGAACSIARPAGASPARLLGKESHFSGVLTKERN